MVALTDFLIDLEAKPVSTDELRKRWRQGRYKGASLEAMKAYLKFARGIE